MDLRDGGTTLKSEEGNATMISIGLRFPVFRR
jgi:hypothetical protein